MQLKFYKYQGTGNDFILLDNRKKLISLTHDQIYYLCDRKYGIGADGLMLLEKEEGYDFKMVYYNADGNESTMCGNGGRCIVAFARKLGIIKTTAKFFAIDGAHEAVIEKNHIVQLKMTDVENIKNETDHSLLDTGSPHYVRWVHDIENLNVFENGKTIRNEERFQPKGINVNFAQKGNEKIIVRTYERGVEDETLSCGTGVTAVAIASVAEEIGLFTVNIETPGGGLLVTFEKETKHSAKNIFLSGAATFVYEGVIDL